MSANTSDSNLDNIIKKNFNLPIQQRRVKKEIQSLKELDQNSYKVGLQSTPLGLKIIVNLTRDFIVGEVQDATKFEFPIIFEFLLEPRFPFVFPKLLCKTNFFTPSLADGREFVKDAIQRVWNPSIMLRDIVIFIPDFLKRLTQLSVPEESQLYGQYYLGHLYNLEDFLSMESVTVFPASEMINEQSVNNERFLVITESFFLNFESVDKVRNTLRLIGWAHVHSIARIKKNKENDKMLVFLWHDSNQKGILVQNIFVLDQAKELIETITRLSQKYGEIAEAIQSRRDLPLSEVTAKNYRDMDITELLENILYVESKLEAELNISNVNLLTNLYQKAVEYYSALNDENFSDYIQKLQDLLARQDIQTILSSKSAVENDNTEIVHKKSGEARQDTSKVDVVEKLSNAQHEEAILKSDPSPKNEQIEKKPHEEVSATVNKNNHIENVTHSPNQNEPNQTPISQNSSVERGPESHAEAQEDETNKFNAESSANSRKEDQLMSEKVINATEEEKNNNVSAHMDDNKEAQKINRKIEAVLEENKHEDQEILEQIKVENDQTLPTTSNEDETNKNQEPSVVQDDKNLEEYNNNNNVTASKDADNLKEDLKTSSEEAEQTETKNSTITTEENKAEGEHSKIEEDDRTHKNIMKEPHVEENSGTAAHAEQSKATETQNESNKQEKAQVKESDKEVPPVSENINVTNNDDMFDIGDDDDD